MRKDNSFKQAARWVAKMFGYKAENKYARGVWYVFATSAAIFALIFTTALVFEVFDLVKDSCEDAKYERMVNSPTYLHDYCNQYVSPYVIYHDGYPGYLYNTLQGHRTVTGVQWICKSSDGDSIAVYCTNEEHKRGYFNRFTGEEVVQAQFEKAWIFSEGVACVYDKGTLHFIDHKGKALMGKVFPYTPRIDDYCFHNGLCQMLGDNNRIGLIDNQGNWAVEPEYYQMSYDTKGFWLVQDREWNYGLLDAKGQLLLPIEYDNSGYRAEAYRYHDGLALIEKDKRYGYCDMEGRPVIWPCFESAYQFTDGLAPVKLGQWGYLDTKGDFFISPIFDMASPFEYGRSEVIYQGEIHKMNTEGRCVKNCKNAPRSWRK